MNNQGTMKNPTQEQDTNKGLNELNNFWKNFNPIHYQHQLMQLQNQEKSSDHQGQTPMHSSLTRLML